MPIPAGFRAKPKLTRKQEERKEKITGFMKDYKDLCEKHNLKLDAYFNYTPRGQVAVLDVLFLKLPIEYEGKPEQIQKDKERIGKLVEPFLKEYEVVKEKHQLMFHAITEIGEDGIFPRIRIKEFKKPGFEVKDLETPTKGNEEENADTDK